MALHKNGRMKEKFVGSLLAVLLVPALGTASSCHAQATGASRQNFQGNKQVVFTQPSPQLKATRVEAQKVGQYQYQARADIERDSIAKIQSHELEGRQAATVYLRNIPVITFLDESIEKTDAKASNTSSQLKVAGDRSNPSDSKKSTNSNAQETDPVWRASSLAARLNQLARNNVDPKGKWRWAAVKAFWLKRSPLALRLPSKPGPYQEAQPLIRT